MTNSKRLTLNQIQLVAWGASAACALILCCGVVFGISYARHKAKLENEIARFEDKSSTAFRRIEAELAVNNAQAVPALTDMFKAELSIDRLQILNAWPSDCPNTAQCLRISSGAVTRYARIETRYGNYVLIARDALPSLWSNFDMGSLWWVALALGAISFAGVLIQRAITRKFIIKPISRLVQKTAGKEEIPPHYPLEIAQLANELADSLDARDQVVFGQLASGVIHDLRTQIQSMISAVSLVEEVADNNTKRLPRLELLQQAAHRNLPKMLKVIESTLDGSREISVSADKENIQETLSNCVREWESLASERNVHVELHAEDLPTVPHDGPQVERVFNNLIKNAIEAFDSDSSHFPLRTVRLSARSADGAIEIDVEDSGPGISLPQRDLFKLAKTTKPNGYGLGLMVSRRIVEAHKGSIESGNSIELKGARFTVRLPLGGVQ
jgi:signal transduction histidine kinase